MIEFTKGKWEYWKDANYPYWYVGKKGSGRYLATVDKEANARLIAAAPDMYELLLEIKEVLKQYDCEEALCYLGLEELLARIDGKEEQA